jgi:methionyl-tRNA formyltransferase
MAGRAYRVVLIGNGTIAVKGLYILKDLGINVPLVLADPKDPGEHTWRLSLLRAATELGYERDRNLFAPENPNDPRLISVIAKSSPTLVLSLQCRRIIRKPLISIPDRRSHQSSQCSLAVAEGLRSILLGDSRWLNKNGGFASQDNRRRHR